MAVVTRDKTLVRPLAGAIIRRGESNATLEAGELVYLNGTSGWEGADGSAIASSMTRGIMVAPQDAVDGDQIDICVFGPVEGYASMTPGASHYVSDTTGEVDTAAGTKAVICGWAASATVLFFHPSVAADPT